MERELVCSRCCYEFITAHQTPEQGKMARCPRCGSYVVAKKSRRIKAKPGRDGLFRL